MALLIGQPIDARELEQVTSAWPPDRFAAMCDALAWAVSGRAFSKLPDFRQRVNAKDGGIDAEWDIPLPKDDHSLPTPILGPGWNVFQYKKRDLLAQDRKHIISTLKSSLKGAVAEVVSRHKRHPVRYVLFVNLDLKSEDKAKIRESILKDYSEKCKIHVEIIGAAELAAFLNNHPHLRAAYFTPGPFKTWEEAFKDHKAQKLFGANVELIGREKELKQLKTLIDDQRVRVIILSGPHDMGKSRLALEATQHRMHDVVVALDPRSMELSDYRSLVSDKKEVICIIEDPEPKDLRSLVGEVLTLPSLKVIITFPARDSISVPAYGVDDRVWSCHLDRLTHESARRLLNATGISIDFGIEDWILTHAGGNPGVLLTAASLGNALRRDVPSFTEAVGREFERRIKDELGEEKIKCASLISLLTHVGIAGVFESELEVVCQLFGDGWTSHDVLVNLDDLEKAGIARRGGSFAEITLPLLANYLTSKMLRARKDQLLALFGKLPLDGTHRLIRRLSEVKGTETQEFWDAMFASDGLLGTFKQAISHLSLLRLIAGTVPDHVLSLLETGLRHATLEERLAIEGDSRHELNGALEELLYRKKTSAGAVRLIWLLAEAKNEILFDSSPQLLKECFHVYNPQMPLSLVERIGLLKEFTTSEVSKQGKLLAIECIENALSPHATFSPFTSLGPEPLDAMHRPTFEELCSYGEALIGILFNLEKNDHEVADAALRALPSLTADLGTQISPELGLKHLKTLVDWARFAKPGLDVSALFSTIHSIRRELSEALQNPEFPKDREAEFRHAVEELDRLKKELESANFSVRLKRWAGSWGYDLDIDEPQPDGRQKYEHELEQLAAEAVSNKELPDPKLMEWLVSPSAQRAYSFFFSLGEVDERQIFLGLIEELGNNSSGVGAFSAYWGGWAKKDPKAAEARLDQLAEQNAVSGESIILSTNMLQASAAAVNRVRDQIKASRVDPQFVAGTLQIGRWLQGLTEDEFLELARAIAGPSFEYAGSVVRLLGVWEHSKCPLQGNLADFAWQCLEHDPTVRDSSDAWHIDRLAAKLLKDDPDRGFQLFSKALETSNGSSERWNPLGLHETPEFWKALHAQDGRRLIGILLQTFQKDDQTRLRHSWRIKEFIDPVGDKQVLVSFAKEDIVFARIIATWLTSAKAGFWPLVFELHQLYPGDELLHNNLAAGIQQMGSVIKGPMSQFYETRKGEIEQKLKDPSTPMAVKPWLQEMVQRLGHEITSQVVWEYDMDVNHLVGHIRNKDSSQRLWAIGRVLKFAKWEDIRRLLTVDDIEEALPHVDLPEKRRTMLEQALPVWRHGK